MESKNLVGIMRDFHPEFLFWGGGRSNLIISGQRIERNFPLFQNGLLWDAKPSLKKPLMLVAVGGRLLE